MTNIRNNFNGLADWRLPDAQEPVKAPAATQTSKKPKPFSLSHYVYDRLVISRLGEENPALPELMREQPEMMRSFLYDLAEATLHYTLHGSTPEEFAKEYPGIDPVILRDEVCHEMRILARNRFGKKYDARSVIAMAMFRSDARHITGEEFVGEKSHKFMHEVMLNWLEEMPLR